MQVDAPADAGAQRTCVIADPRRSGEADRVDLVGDLLGEPQAHVHPPAARIVPGSQAREQHARGDDGDRHATERRREHEQADDQQPQRHVRKHLESGEELQEGRRGQEIQHPADAGEDEQGHPEQRLQPLHAARRRLGAAELGIRLLVQRVAESLRHRAQARDVVDVGDGELRHAHADARDELRRGERPAAEVEEVGLAVDDGHAEHRLPLLRKPRFARGEIRRGQFDVRQRPGKGRAIDLAGRAHREVVDDREERDHRCGKARRELRPCGDPVEVGRRGEVPDEHGDPRLRGADGGRGPRDAGEVLQGGFDLAQFDTASADFHLVIGAALEEEPGRLEDDEVTGAVRAVPAERRHGCVLLGILRGVEVAGEADAADDELPDAALGDRLTVAIDDREHPAVERQADADGARHPERRGACDDGRLGRAVGVPHFAIVGCQARGELRRARLAAEDQEADVVDRLGRPHRGERRHGRDDGDALAQEPRSEILPRAHERARGRDEASAMSPRQPHLFARGVEGDRQPREHPVARAERSLLEEQARLRVDERRSGAVAHRDALGDARRPRREDDPRVVVDSRRRHRHERVRRRMRGGAVEEGRVGLGGRRIGVLARILRFVRAVPGLRGRRRVRARTRDDAAHPRLAEHEPCAFVGVVRVDGNVRGTGGQDAEDRDVELFRARWHPHTDAVPAPDAGPVQSCGRRADARHHLRVAEGARSVVDGGCLRVPRGGRPQDVEQRPFGRSLRGTVEDRLAVHRHVRRAGRSAAPS